MKERSSQFTQVLALLCLLVFALCVLLVVLSGASCYQDLVERGEVSYADRTAIQYLTTRVNQAQRVKIEDFEGMETLILEETIDGVSYTTRVYCHDGWLRELYTVPGAKVHPDAGMPILEGEKLNLSKQGSLLKLILDGRELLLYLEVGS